MTLSSFRELLIHMLDPRGRCNRKGLLIVAGLLLAAEFVVGALLWAAGADLEGTTVLAFKSICIWLAICAGSKRLHDMNLRAWWMLGVLVATTIWTLVLVVAIYITAGEQALEPGTAWYMIALAGSAAPILGATLWLHFRRGEQGVNRFGGEPTGIGFSGPAWNFQPLADGMARLQRMMVPQAA